MRLTIALGLALLLSGCPKPGHGTGDGGTHDGGGRDGGPADAGPSDGSVPLHMSGLVFDGPLDAGVPATGQSYAIEDADGGGPAGASFGSPCTKGDDCAALGANAACLKGATGGFCTFDCTMDPEGPSQICPAGTYCFGPIVPTGQRMCLAACATQADCTGGMRCSGTLGTLNTLPDPSTQYTHVCFPPCTSDADCNTGVATWVCDPKTSRCLQPLEDVVGNACTGDADCEGLGPGGACMKSTHDPAPGYCTLACDPTATSPCDVVNTIVGTCVTGYAKTPAGDPVPVCLKNCGSDAQCQAASPNTCNYIPPLGEASCTIACLRDADCPDGTCDVATGDCRQSDFFSTRCGSGSNCPGGLCVTDLHINGLHDCSKRCATDADCPSGAVCVTSPDAMDSMRVQFGLGGSVSQPNPGFCAPSCTMDGGTCPDPMTTCLAPSPAPHVDIPGSGSASGDFCWK